MFQDIYQTIIYSLISVISLYILTRIMGKREVSQLTFFDYIVGISIGSISASFAIDSSIGYVKGITSLITYAFFAIALSYISLKSYSGRKILNSKPTILIENGRILEGALKKTRMNINDLLAECRVKNIFNVSEIELAILETSGKVSVLLKEENKPVTIKNMNLPIPSKSISINIIIDGKILNENLKYIKQDKEWINAQLKNSKIKSISDILLAYVDVNNNFSYYLKNNEKCKLPKLN